MSCGTPHWTDEDYFQKAREILIAEMQKIVYHEYLPIIMGNHSMSQWDLNLQYGSTYDSSTDPTHYNSFATAAFRFGHSMIQGASYMSTGVMPTSSIFQEFELGENFFNVSLYEFGQGRGMDLISMGSILQNAQSSDTFVASDIVNKLYANRSDPGSGFDLIARNIQRGRDHGLPSYAAFYKALHQADNTVMDCWDKKPSEISQSKWDRLQEVYIHPHHIDLFVGGMAETQYNSGLMGRTFQAIIGMNFRDLKNGDRFFFSHEGNMNKDRYDYVMDRTLGDIICDNSKYISHVHENVFLSNSPIKACACKEKKIPECKKVFLAL